ncbi:putative F-box protein At1g32660 [Triticum dicoccoides]|uniref:putative F-box protein At1g32660 n=1 Tax=Triticum dicoccoides TaxID=85692 RepID=UPI00188E6A74|nr:putative F-box protein At1g32660 [Triticum dicoccoides]
MPPGGGGEHGCTGQHHPLATGRRDEGASSYPMPPPPLIVPVASEKKKKKKKKQEQEQEQEHENNPAGSLPEGPLVEILSRVPYKSLCRFKCVSKPWQDEDEDEVEEYLCFDPAVPSSFVVLTHTWDFTEVAIYSSDTGRWTTVESGWTDEAPVGLPVFLNGTLHLMTPEYAIVTVDTEGKVWGQIDIPGNMRDSSDYPFIGQSQGRLYAWCINDNIDVCQLSVWALEDYGGAKWALKDC